MKASILDAVVLVLAATACANPRQENRASASNAESVPETTATPPDQGLSPTDSARIRYWSFIDTFPETRRELLARRGQPRVVLTDTLRNNLDSTVLDTIVTFQYDGLAARFYVRGIDGGDFLVGLFVTRADVRLPLLAGLGSTRDALEQALGSPWQVRQRGDSLFLQFTVPGGDGGSSNELVFTLTDGVVREVQWMFGGD